MKTKIAENDITQWTGCNEEACSSAFFSLHESKNG